MPQIVLSHLKENLFISFVLRIMVESTESFDLHHTFFRARPELLCECLNVTLRSLKLHIAGAKHLTRFAYTRALYDVAAFRSLRLESGSLSA